MTDRPVDPSSSAVRLARRAYGGGRISAQRVAICSVSAELGDAFTVEELMEAVRAHDPASAGQATVYRAVAAMAEAGFLERVGTRGGSALYARCDAAGHHHHIVCEGCGRTLEADCPLGPRVAEDAAARGFTITRHEVTLYGLCSTCTSKGPVT